MRHALDQERLFVSCVEDVRVSCGSLYSLSLLPLVYLSLSLSPSKTSVIEPLVANGVLTAALCSQVFSNMVQIGAYHSELLRKLQDAMNGNGKCLGHDVAK